MRDSHHNTANTKRDTTKRSDTEERNDVWMDNVHIRALASDNAEARKLANHRKLINSHDKFVEYIRHIESKLRIQLYTDNFQMPRG